MPKCFLRLNTPTVRERIKHAGFTICACASFEEAVWLCYFPGCTYDIHGIGYGDEESDLIEHELRRLLDESKNNVLDCGIDVELFISPCQKELAMYKSIIRRGR